MLITPYNPIIQARRKIHVDFVASEILATDTTTYTFSSINLPRIKGNNKRVVVVAFHGEDSATAFTPSSATFGGIALTELAQAGNFGTTQASFYAGTASLDELTSGQPAVTWSEAITSAGYGLWVVHGFSGGSGNVFTSIDTAAGDFTGTRNHQNGGLFNDLWFWCGTSGDASPSGVVSFTGEHQTKLRGDYNTLGTEIGIAGTHFFQYGQRINETIDFTGAGNCNDVLLRIRERIG
jgi:hypothetical protein